MLIKIKELYCHIDKTGMNHSYEALSHDTYLNTEKIESIAIHKRKANINTEKDTYIVTIEQALSIIQIMEQKK